MLGTSAFSARTEFSVTASDPKNGYLHETLMIAQHKRLIMIQRNRLTIAQHIKLIATRQLKLTRIDSRSLVKKK
jgi:hypothetical protein